MTGRRVALLAFGTAGVCAATMATLAACGGRSELWIWTDDAGAADGEARDATADATHDVAMDRGADGERDAGADASRDGTLDAALDGAFDAALDAAMDGGVADAAADADADASVTGGASCEAGGNGASNCGPTSESCCTSLEVEGGTFARRYGPDFSSVDGSWIPSTDPATVSDFRLDKYEVTVGRFRQYVEWVTSSAGAPPPGGSGKHVHVHAGLGLSNSETDAGTFESGWDPLWSSTIAAGPGAVATWNANLVSGAACAMESTWSASPAGKELMPVNCINWYEALAFCIWDGGFLPTQAEWEYASAGGAEQRLYPWGSADPGRDTGYLIYDCLWPPGSQGAPLGCTVDGSNIAPVGTAQLGAGKWGQLDLSGNLGEWVMDQFPPQNGIPPPSWDQFRDPCVDCAWLGLPGNTNTVMMGGDFGSPWVNILPAWTYYSGGNMGRGAERGVRCARAP